MPYLVIFLGLTYSLFSWSHQASTNSYGQKIKWNYSNIPLTIHPHSSFPLGYNQVLTSIGQWNLLGEVQIFPSATGLNSIQFTNNSYFGSGVVGVTELNYDRNGIINYGSIFLNIDRVSQNREKYKAFIPDVVTHELGHFLGLNHSEVSNSTMFFQNHPGQDSLAADDRAGLRSIYSNQYGTIQGFVKGGNNIGVLGVHVQAISRTSGEIIGSISNADGSFTISGLPLNDTYYLYTSPLKNLASLPKYYANVQTEFCPAKFIGGFFTECSKFNDGLPQGITLTNMKRSVNAGIITIHCDLKVQEDYMIEKLMSSFSPIVIFDWGQERKYDKSFVGYFEENKILTSSRTDKFIVDLTHFDEAPVSKHLKVRVLSQAIGSPIDAVMRVHKSGSIIGTFSKTQPYLDLIDTKNFDLVADIPLSSVQSLNYFELHIEGLKSHESWLDFSYPGGKSFLQSGSLPYLIILSIEEGGQPILLTETFYSDNASCLDAPFTYPVEKTNAFSEEIVVNGKKDNEMGPMTCASIDTHSGPGNGPFMGIMTLGFIFSILLGQLSKSRKNILS